MIREFGIVCESMPAITIVILVALLAIPKRLSAATRHQTLIAAAVVALLTPALLPLMPKWQVLPRVDSTPQASVVAVSGNDAPSLTSGMSTIQAISRSTGSPQNPTIHLSPMAYRTWFRWAAAVWLAGVGLAILRMIFHWLVLRRMIRATTPASDEIHRIARSIIGRTVRVRMASNTGDAYVHGVFSPVMVLPATVKQLPYHEFHMILSHELAHIRRRDPLCNWILQIFLAMFWFHPLAWLLAKRCRLAQEMATDDMVLLSGSKAEPYAACLCSAALRHRSRPTLPEPAAAFARQHPLLARVHAILDTGRRRTVSRMSGWIPAGVPVLAPALLVASLGFKAASEAQPIHRAQWQATAKADTQPSIWSDVVEPLATLARHSPASHESVAAGRPAFHETEAPSFATTAAPAPSTRTQPRSSTEHITSPAPDEDYTDVADAPRSLTPSPLPSRMASARRAKGTIRSGSRTTPAEATVSTPSSAEGAVSKATISQTNGSLILSSTVSDAPGTVSSAMSMSVSAKQTPTSASKTVIYEKSSISKAQLLTTSAISEYEGTEGMVSFSLATLPAEPFLEIVPFDSGDGPHLAATWTVPASQATTWIPEVSQDLSQWTSSTEELTVIGPVPMEEGFVRFMAIVREPSSFPYLRLSYSAP